MKKCPLALALLLAGSICSAVETYNNPVDGKRYTAEKWKTYKPEGGVHACLDKVCLGGVRLLQDQSEIAQRTTPEEVARLIEDAVEVAKQTLSGQDGPLEVMVQFTCDPKVHKVDIAYQGEATQEALQLFYDALGKIPPIATSDTVLFQLTVRVQS